MDGTELDEIMNGVETPEVIDTVVAPETVTQPRDETGKFAPKADDAPVVDPDNAAQAAVEGGEHEKGRVPVAAVIAERNLTKAARDEAEKLRNDLAELRGQVSVLTQQRQQPATPVEKAKPKNFWENPDEFLADRLAPVQQTMQTQRIELSTMLAVEKHGEAVVNEAQAALAAAMKANPNDPSLIALDQQTRKSIHPMNDVLSWHTRQKAMADIGDDPSAYRTRLETELREKIMAELGVDSAALPAATSTTTKPLTKLPQSLSKLPGAGNGNGGDDLSDTGLFTHAMGGR